MKRTTYLALATLLLLAVGGATAQSLGDYARAARKNKTGDTSTVRHFDNDNLPTNDGLSVVGPPPTADGTSTEAKAAAPAPAPGADQRQKNTAEWQSKLDAQRQKLDSLNRELSLDQRELQIRAVQLNADPTIRLRDGGQWDKQELQFKADAEEKQKALDDARQQLDELQDKAHKAGVAIPDKDDDSKSSDNKNK
jgi:hypothetical protein